MRFLRFVTLAVLITTWFPLGAAAADKPRRASIDRALRDAAPRTPRPRVIVRYRPGKEREVRDRLAARGALTLGQNESAATLTVELAASEVDRAAEDPDIFGLSADALVSTEQTLDLSMQTRGALKPGATVRHSFDAQALRQTLGVALTDTGHDVGVAIIDSGITPTKDLQGRIAAFYDFTKGGIATSPTDAYGHGTHVAGLIAGSGVQSNGKYVGVAIGARLIGLKVLNSQGQGYTSDVIAAIDFAVANRARLRIDVLNLSLGHPVYEPAATDPLVLAVERAVAAGLVVVVSAGNLGVSPHTGEIGFGGITSPGNARGALTVGSLRTKATATRFDDEVSPFSSRGPTWYDAQIKPDVLAPGQALVAVSGSKTRLFQDPALRADVSPYVKLSGTSMAAAVTSGVVALVIDAHRRDQGYVNPLTPNTVKALLQYTAIPVADPDPATPAVLEQGTGGVNAAGAMALARAIDPSMPLRSSWLEYGVQPSSVLGGAPATWAQHIVWGDHLVWGDTVTWNLTAWAQHIVWGDSDDAHIVWGDLVFFHDVNAVTESFLAWSTHIVWGDAVHVVWGDSDDGHIVWGDLGDEHIVWGDSGDEHIVWGDTRSR